MILIPLTATAGQAMSAPALRRLEIGRALSDEFEVVFALPDGASTEFDFGGARCVRVKDRSEFAAALSKSQFLYTLGVLPKEFSIIARSGVRVILDLYVPRAFEVLESHPNLPESVVHAEHRRDVFWTQAILGLADLMVCTNSFQRDFWIGFLIHSGLVNITDVRRSPDLADKIAVVPHGLSKGQFQDNSQERSGVGPLRSMLSFDTDDCVFLWSSRVLAWQDPVTLMKAMKQVVQKNPYVRLVLLGVGKLPDKDSNDVDGHGFRTQQALHAARETELLGTNIFFVEDRIPHSELGAFYRDCDAAVGTYPASLETHFCLATRLLDYVCAELPVVLSGCQLQRDFVEKTGAGVVVEPGNVEQLTENILDFSDGRVRSKFVEKMRSARKTLEWKQIVNPIREHCRLSTGKRRPKPPVTKCATTVARFYMHHAALRLRQRLNGGEYL